MPGEDSRDLDLARRAERRLARVGAGVCRGVAWARGIGLREAARRSRNAIADFLVVTETSRGKKRVSVVEAAANKEMCGSIEVWATQAQSEVHATEEMLRRAD